MNQTINPGITIGELVRDDYRTAEVFKKFNIDFCCGGKKTIDEVCSDNNISTDELTNALSDTVNKNNVDNEHNFKDWEPDFLANYIVKVHHKYVAENIPLLLDFSCKIANVHGERHKELIKIADLFNKIAEELQHHMMKEERILFPYISDLWNSYKNNVSIGSSTFGTVRNPIAMMEMEHENAVSLLKQMRELSDDYKIPKDACATYSVTYQKLDEFENDLHQHIHLENNILFPKAIELEEKLIRQ